MLKYILSFLLAASPICLKAQASLWSNDPAAKLVMKNDCDGKVFNKVEILPSIKAGNAAFEDTLAYILKAKNAFDRTDKVVFKFIITGRSQIFDLARESGEIEEEKIVKESLINLSALWLPALQNGRPVCSNVRIEINIKKGKLHINIFQ